MTLQVDGRPVPCPRCGTGLPGWQREELHDGTYPRIVRTVECDCGFGAFLEDLLVQMRPPRKERQHG